MRGSPLKTVLRPAVMRGLTDHSEQDEKLDATSQMLNEDER